MNPAPRSASAKSRQPVSLPGPARQWAKAGGCPGSCPGGIRGVCPGSVLRLSQKDRLLAISTARDGGEVRRGSARSRARPGGPMLALNLASSQERGRAPSTGPRGGRLRADLPLGNVCQEGSTPEIPTPPHLLWVPGSPTASWLLWTSESQQPLSEDKCLSCKK